PYPDMIKEFVGAYGIKYPGEDLTTDSAHPYIGCQILEQAILKAGTIDREKLTEVIHRETFETIVGPVKYDERGVNILEKGFLAQCQNTYRVIVWPPELAQAEPWFWR
ncbi:transporter substrate-binding protein, partial [Patescibacteria group bacterium]|nr:transporter substrate-binding protein [Patescibacteria group bacterium]